MKKKFLDYFMTVAEATAQLSSAVRLKVGTVIVRDNKILATGYNGTPSGWDNDCEYVEFMPFDAGGWLDPTEIWHQWPLEGKFWINGVECDKRYRLKTKEIVLHSEANALTKIARSTESSDGATMFCTHAPCMQCAKLIYQSGIRKLWWRDAYRDTDGLEFLRKGGVEIENYNNSTSGS
jgi:dCMP deaminase